MKKLLLTFYNKNGRRKPKRLVFYRDGVSEGQFAEVQYCEIPQIRAACMEVCFRPCPLPSYTSVASNSADGPEQTSNCFVPCPDDSLIHVAWPILFCVSH